MSDCPQYGLRPLLYGLAKPSPRGALYFAWGALYFAWTAHLDSSVSTAFLWRKIASASSIKILATQLRKAPSYSKSGGFREATILQFSTALPAPSCVPRMRYAKK